MGVRVSTATPRTMWGIIIALALVVAGCTNAAPGSNSGEGGSNSTSYPNKNGGNSQVLRLNYGQSPYSAAVLKAFKEQHPNIKVEVTNKTLTFEDGSVQTSLRSGQGPDVMLVNSGPGRVGAVVKAGLLADLTDVYNQGARKRYPKNILDQINHNGKIYEVVEGRDVFELHYNEKIFQKAGVEPPRTWNDLLATCQRLAAVGVRPITVGARDNFSGGWLLGTLIESSAGSATFKNLIFGNGSWTQPSVLDGAKKLEQLITNGCINSKEALALTGEQAEANIGHGRAAMMVQTEHMNADLEQDKVDTSSFRSMPMPSNNPANIHPTSGLAVSWIVNAKSPSLAADKEWIRWVSSADYLKVAAKNGYYFAPAELVPKSVEPELGPAIVKSVRDANVQTGYNPSVYLPANAKDAWYNAVQSLLSNPKQDPMQPMRALNNELGRAGG